MSTDSHDNSVLESFVIVAAYGRSGSTLVQGLLNSIDGWCIRGENDNGLVPLSQAWANMARSPQLKRMREAGAPSRHDDPWAGADLIDPQAFGESIAHAFLNHVIRPPRDTRVAGFKEIRWPLQPASFDTVFDFVHRFFPNAKFIFNTRNHDEVARSGWWARQDPASVHSRLEQYEAVFHDCIARHPDRTILIHYNDYITDHGALAPLFDFLGEPFDRSRIDAVISRRLDHLKDWA